MFSRYKKQPEAQPVQTPAPASAAASQSATTTATAPAANAVARKPLQKKAAEALGSDRDRKRKERLGEIKIELHRELLENLNLAALENAGEAELRAEISAIASEV
ncbi:MAG: CpaF family protein, partial [Pseudomonadota bacterium]